MNSKQKKKGKKKIIFIILIAIVIVALLLLLINNNQKEEKEVKEVTSDVKKSKYRLSDNNLSNFDLSFLQLENKKENKIYSPLSIKYALAMLKEGASGNSKKQISNIIGDYKSKKYSNSSNMSFANAIFIRDSYKDSVNDDYIKSLSSKFNADVIYDSFASPDNINSWVSEKTLNLIKNLISDLSNDDKIVLVNALGIDMEWAEKFLLSPGTGIYTKYSHEDFSWNGAKKIKSEKFDNDTQEVAGMDIIASLNNYDVIKEIGEDKIKQTVEDEYRKYLSDPNNQWELEGDTSKEHIDKVISEYLQHYISEIKSNYHRVDKTTDFSLYVDDNIKAFAKDLKEYDNTTLQYVAIMPVKEDLDSYIKNIDSEKINKIINSLKELKTENFKNGVVTKITGFIPKFKFEYNLDLKADLNKLGIKDIFEKGNASLTEISSDKDLFVTDATHKATIEFTQDGIKASAATSMGGLGAGGAFDYLYDVPVEEIDLTFDKPYMFIIRDKSTGEVWFSGTVYEPLKWIEDPDYNSSNY